MKKDKKEIKKITKKGLAILLAGTMVGTVFAGCNKQVVDLNKSFNVVVEANEDNVSLVAVKYYSDYNGMQSQFVTEDGLRVLTSAHQANFLNVKDSQIAEDFALALAGNDSEKVIDYNELQGVEIDTKNTIYNKDGFDMHYKYNKAIILSGDNAIIVDLKTWKDYDSDDKIQLTFKNGTTHLTSIDKIKIINDEKAKDDSLKNYAISLVGDEQKVVFYDAGNSKSNSK